MSDQAPVDPQVLKPGMELCTFDFQRWGDFTALLVEGDTTYLVGKVEGTGVEVYVPASEIVETHGRCIRLTQPRAEIDGVGWDRNPRAAQA